MNELVQFLEDTGLWRFKKSWSEPMGYVVFSEMKGFTEGRYRIEIDELKRRVKGFRYKLRIYFTPYNPNHLVHEERFNNINELTNALNNVSPKLLDKNRRIT